MNQQLGDILPLGCLMALFLPTGLDLVQGEQSGVDDGLGEPGEGRVKTVFFTN